MYIHGLRLLVKHPEPVRPVAKWRALRLDINGWKPAVNLLKVVVLAVQQKGKRWAIIGRKRPVRICRPV